MIKINRYNPIYANYYNRKDMRQNTNRIENRSNILMNTFSKMLTKKKKIILKIIFIIIHL